jgi:hypothetical protein
MLITEDGTGRADAESYCSVDDADTYHANRGNTTWATLTTDEKEQALRRATDYLLEVYRLRWKGTRINGEQSLDWPRGFVERDDFEYQGLNGSTFIGGHFFYPSDEVPQEVENACALMAWKAAAGELAPDLSQGVLREKVDVLEVQYDANSPQYVRYRAIDNLLRPFLQGGANSSKVKRV